MTRWAAAAALLASLLAAGCGDPSRAPVPCADPCPTETPGGGAADAAAGLPAWSLGDWWTYQTPLGASTYVVTGDQGDDWFLDTDNPETAFRDAREDISRLGAVRKSDLAGSQGSDRVEFFHWPLRDGESWTTRWDHRELTITAHDAGGGRFGFEAVGTEGLAYRYTYDPAVRWFRDIHVFSNGTEQFALTLSSSGHSFRGEAVRWHLTEVVARSGTGGTTDGAPFEVPSGTTDIWAGYRLHCAGGGGYTFALLPANPGLAGPQSDQQSGACDTIERAESAIEGPHPGTWTFAISVGGPTADFEYTVLLRTLERVPVG